MQSLHKPSFELTYLVIPNYVYKDTRLTLIQLKVYGFIHSYINPFLFGNENLAKMFNCSERSISEALAKLEEYGYIAMKHTPKSGGGTTRLAVDCYSDSQSSSSRKSKSEATTRTVVLHKEKENNKKNFSENEVPNELNSILPIRKKDRVYKIGGGYQQPFGNTPSYKKSFSDKPVRKGRSAEDIR